MPKPDTIYRTPSINSRQCARLVRELKLDILIAIGCGIVRELLVEMPELVVLNAHAGRLPFYRGMNVVEWALLNHDSVVGTIHRIDKGIDTGDILFENQIELPLEKLCSIQACREFAFYQTFRLYGKAISALIRGAASFRQQPPGLGRTFYVMHPRLKQVILRERLGEMTCSGETA